MSGSPSGYRPSKLFLEKSLVELSRFLAPSSTWFGRGHLRITGKEIHMVVCNETLLNMEELFFLNHLAH